jgi:hypothetical protein
MPIPKPSSDNLDRTREAGEIFRLARRIGVSAGLERSFKITPAGVDARRFLISLALRPDFRPALHAGLRALSFPAGLLPGLEESLKATRFLHLGYEEPQGRPACKLYCEAAPAEGTRVRVHVGFKWRPGDADTFACDEYWRLGGLDKKTLRAHIAETLEPNTDLLAAVSPLLDPVLARVPLDELFFLEVMRGGVRRSFDLRLYYAGLPLKDVAATAQMAAEVLGAEPVGGLIAACGEDRLGHASAGPSFVTFYHGAEDLA